MGRSFFTAALLAGLVSCAAPEPPPQRKAIAVVAQTVRFLPEQTQVEAIGTARAAVSAELYPETAGRVTAVLFKAGEYVKEGQPLLKLDARQERLAVDAADVQLREADQLLSRYRRIEDTGALSESQIEAGETALASARVGLEQARTALSDRTVRAPFSGHVGLTQIDRGDRVSDSTPITQIDQRSTLYVDLPAPEAVFSALRPGQLVQVTPFSDPGRTIDARVVVTDTRVAQDSRNFIVRTALANSDDAYRPGMSFRVLFSSNGVSRATVPEEAIVWGGEGSHLFLVRGAKAVRVPVTITSRRGGLVYVDGALEPGDRVITQGVQKVRDGQEIRIVQPFVPDPQTVKLRQTNAARATEERSNAR
ncbi:efflux RND transporter periplasmic adaptor subunit [Croceicoccus sp. F390]|uniref:Efflux RND transporter periplasmic adaptor subunit n=1 Tax=Croceicoccus esteveae TaxID=3075597 RepID=A0ABU2ZKC0_9SPHN|nr:efflux RND transporter periplasmic adaptor subunit [Croceicoccus sp. F390]MDT0577059.1 efflux RND transporter periplasmic adaptor subunit [Croceicoccus sp. F390]